MNVHYNASSDTISFDDAGTVNKQMPRIQLLLILLIAAFNLLFSNQTGSIHRMIWIFLAGLCGIFLFWSFIVHKNHHLSFYAKDIQKVFATKFIGFRTIKVLTKDGQKNQCLPSGPDHRRTN
ncbi:hypothetical protein Echvi_1085 [Echinicola vietnamensis DSM 17526]|uniref:Uncharacterized protein n=1 Tax=Echinicola vietnamensis (strain DSM 17526 / LMG 23754 / KMM 6221) TaxID=926556 RepID=L0FX68_ECHVK|nr:hypothetical protein Echvi_1085 [Echinicola vietnamensis DSM 17526]